ncbi:alpha-D-ribose 1-methylphosphonate 5-triphosphate diphosphatase [Desulfuromusa kysingii]|uniref:Alpha-D-ribose 1-methylphosphonate 5-triphosphate diphosphatase n=1 Tax=Desulfuromusa kysingii TaxID=37625 RepID=A0A1H3ZVP5_9BACT|nr:alpha-D-ribose 1-methylphosphonate 5-triphosphate diphosphatase [Desulfuromusa kysingii]SEA27777.1 alpha-D-ribose 1-methylphosphonate 5-triphosphate diphosphatase [Desulfuromusa kysingii]
MPNLHFINAKIVTREQVIDSHLTTAGGRICTVAENSPQTDYAEIDLNHDFLLPGLVEIHTDNLEKNIQPRPGVLWPSILAAAMAHDHQIIGSGITTVLDALAIGGLRKGGLDTRIFDESFAAICQGQEQQLFKADHALHLRCEVADPNIEKLLPRYGKHPLVKLISVMDHTPGQRQWTDLGKWRLYHRDKRWTDQQAEEVRQERLELQDKYADINRSLAINFAQERQIPLASHDDTTISDTRASSQAGITIAEFPTSLAAARTAQKYDMSVVMGAPNVVRGGSHSGNVSALDLANLNLLDGLSSDYVPASLLHSAFYLAEKLNIPLPQTIAMVSANVAEMAELTDRGEIAVGKRADLIQVSLIDGLPVVRKVWCAGERVA